MAVDVLVLELIPQLLDLGLELLVVVSKSHDLVVEPDALLPEDLRREGEVRDTPAEGVAVLLDRLVLPVVRLQLLAHGEKLCVKAGDVSLEGHVGSEALKASDAKGPKETE